MESLLHNLKRFAQVLQRIFLQIKRNLHIFSLSLLQIRLFNNLQISLHIWNDTVKGFSKMYILSFFGHFLQTFY